MQYIVIDLEWNQAVAAALIKHNLSGEIIEIGAVKLNDRFRAVDTFKSIIKPVYYKKMKSHVTKITGLDNRALENGQAFENAYADFLDWIGEEEYAFITWGLDDVPTLRQNLLAHGMSDSMLPICYNLQYIFDIQVTGDKKQWSLADAMEKLELVSDLTAHDALHDAENTARICGKLDMAKGVAEYDPLPFRGKRSMLREAKYTGYRTADQVFSDGMIYSTVCPICGVSLHCPNFTPVSKTRTVSRGSCPRHGTFDVTVRYKRDEKGMITAYRSAIVDDPELRKKYYGDMELLEHKRR